MFYDQLKQACKDNNTSITAVLKKIGIGTANGTYWKNGSSPSSDIVIQLSEFLNVSTDFLLKGKKSSIQDNLSEDEKRLLNMYSLLTDIEKGEILGEMKNITKGRGEWELIPMIIIWYVLYLFEMIKVIENFF